MTRQEKIGITKSASDTSKLVQVKSSLLIFKTHDQIALKAPGETDSTKSNNKFIQRSNNKIRQQQKEFSAQITTHRPVRRNTILQQRLSKDFSYLLPLIKKNCPISLQLDYSPGGKGVQTSCAKPTNSSLLPPTQTYLSTNQLQHQIKKHKVEYSSILPIASSTQLIPRSRKSDRNSQEQNKFSTSSENLTFSEEFSTATNLCSDAGRKTSSFHFLSHERPPFTLKQNLTFRDLSPIISCGGKIGLGIPAKLSTPTIVNLSVEANPSKRNPTSLFSDLSTLSRMGLSTAPCLQHTSNSSTDSGISVGTKSSRLSVGSDCLSLRCQNSMTSSSEQTSQLETGQSKALVSEHHSFVNLPSSFNIPIANLGYMTVPGSKGLRSSKSFHGDGTDTGKQGCVPAPGNQHGNLATGSPLRQQQHHRKMLERQRIKMLKPLTANKNHGAMSKITDFSASVLPDPSTSSYRLTSDVSFDEGSRYNSLTGAAYAVDARKESSQRAKETSNDAIRFSSACAASGRLEKLADSPNRDRSNHVTPHKEAMPMSLVRIEERLNFESALGRHPPPGTFTPGSRGQSAQGANPPPAPPTNQLTSFRLHKGRQSWNYKMGDLSVNGGGYYGCSPLQPGGRIESSGIGSLSISPASNFSSKLGTRARERTGSTIKSRMSSRYGCRMDSGFNLSSTRECQYSDPCQSAPASFQQRLIELSVLESDTIKYERSRKLKRKKNLDS